MSESMQPGTGWNGNRPTVAARLRFGMTGLATAGAAIALVQGRASIAQGCMNIVPGNLLIFFVAVPCALIAVLCLLIGLGLRRGSPGWMRTALVLDAILVAGILAYLCVSATGLVLWGDRESLATRLIAGIGAGAVSLLCAAEASSLLHACRGKAMAWRIFGGLLATTVVLAAAIPVVAAHAHRKHVEPLCRYAAAHWCVPPAHASVHVTRDPLQDGMHRYTVEMRTDDWGWCIYGSHEAGRGWTASDLALFVVGQPADASTVRGARERLAAAGVAKEWYQPDGVFSQGQFEACFVFDAPALGGRYAVTKDGSVTLRLSAPVVLPDPR